MSKFSDKIDMSFEYVPAAQTDIRKTIRREQKRLDDERKKQQEADEEAARIVTTIAKRVRG